jgi:hypothetical protein
LEKLSGSGLEKCPRDLHSRKATRQAESRLTKYGFARIGFKGSGEYFGRVQTIGANAVLHLDALLDAPGMRVREKEGRAF